jgi:hypothetical protein
MQGNRSCIAQLNDPSFFQRSTTTLRKMSTRNQFVSVNAQSPQHRSASDAMVAKAIDQQLAHDPASVYIPSMHNNVQSSPLSSPFPSRSAMGMLSTVASSLTTAARASSSSPSVPIIATPGPGPQTQLATVSQ